MYAPDAATVFLLRPDGYLGYRGSVGDGKALIEHLQKTFAPTSG